MKLQRSQVTLRGVLLEKPWGKTVESWSAGGGRYYVLDVGDAQIEERSATEGVILRPSETLPRENFKIYANKRVEIEGEYVQAQPYVPQHSWEQYPLGDEGGPHPRGEGFKVYHIKEIDES